MSININYNEENSYFNILAGQCDLTVTTGSNLINENNTGIPNEIVVAEVTVSGTGNFIVTGLPYFIDQRLVSTSGDVKEYEFFIFSGTVLDYDVISTEQNSKTWTVTGSIYPDCTGTFDITLYDQNDVIPTISNITNAAACINSVKSIGLLYFTDTDITDSFKTINLSIQGANASNFSLSQTSIIAPGSVEVFVNTTGVSTTSLSGEVVANDGTYVKTGILQVDVYGPSATPTINHYGIVDLIPLGLSGSPTNPIVLSHRIPYNYLEFNDIYNCDINCNTIGFSGISYSDIDGGPSNNILKYGSNNSITTRIESNLGIFTTGNGIYGSGRYSFITEDVSGSLCCGFSPYDVLDIVYFGNSLESFATGIGKKIPFSGGSGNVEQSYFEPLGSNYMLLAPQAVDSVLSSNDDYFYLYHYTGGAYSGIVHPTETGLREVVGVFHQAISGIDNVLCTYYSDTSSIFRYNINTQVWTNIQPFTASSYVSRIIKCNDNDGLYFIVGSGSGEFKIYNSINNSLASIVDNTVIGGRILPSNIALIPDLKHTSCVWSGEESVAVVSGNSRYHIFAVDHHYSGDSDYPLILDISSGTLESGDFTLSGNSVSGTTYLHSYINYRPDIINVADRLAISLSNTGNGNSELIIRNNSSTSTNSFHSVKEKRRLSKLINDQILWCSYSFDGTSTVIDPFELQEYSLPIPLTGSISIAAPCNPEYRTLMLDSSGNQAYIINDLDRTYQIFSFDSSLPMGNYHDIFVFHGLSTSVDQSRNFYLMPNQIYQNDFPRGNLVALSTTTYSPTGIILYNYEDNFYTTNETVISFEPNQTTTGLVNIGSFAIQGYDEFNGGTHLAINTGIAGGEIFQIEIDDDNRTGIIYIKSNISLDYETQDLYIAYITGFDPYVAKDSINQSFVLQVLDIDEKPTGIIFTPPYSGGYNANTPTDTNKLVATFNVQDPDVTGNINQVSITGDDADIFTITFNNSNQKGNLFIKSGTVFDIETKDRYYLTLLAAKSGENITASGDWVLYLTDNPPISVSLDPSSIILPENYNAPISGLKLGNFTIQDSDTERDNFAYVIGNDSDYFSIDYELGTNSGSLILEPNNIFDYESQQTITGLIAVGNIIGSYSATGIFIINLTDVFEATGITVTPSSLTLPENIDTSTGSIKLADLSFTNTGIQTEMTIFDLRYLGSGFRSATDKFEIVDQLTRTPELHLKQNAILDYETNNRYDIVVSGRPDTVIDPAFLFGGLFNLYITDVNDPPTITLNPSTITIPNTTQTIAGSFKIADIFSTDEELSSVSFYITGSDSSYFSLQINSGIEDSFVNINVGELFFNSGVVLDINTKSTYTGIIVGVDSSGLTGSGFFTVSLTDSPECNIQVQSNITNNLCINDNNGRIFLDIDYVGNSTTVTNCTINNPISVRWENLPEDANIGLNGSLVTNLPNGTYSGYIFGDLIPLSGIAYTITNTSLNLQILSSIKYNPPCEDSGILTITWSGGIPPYSVGYGNSRIFVQSGSPLVAEFTVRQSLDERVVISDAAGCTASGEIVSFNFDNISNFFFESQSLPTIVDDTAESFKFNITHGNGPHDISIYTTTTGEKGSFVKHFDRYDTSILNTREDRINNIFIGDDDIESVRLNIDNPSTYYYDLQNHLYPGLYVLEFTNTSGCLYLSPPLNVQNIQPMTASIQVEHNNPVDLGFYNISQPILDALFIPYKMLINNSDLLSYISGLTEKSDIKLEINGNIYSRKVLDGSVNCDTYSILNIKFLGIDNIDWFYTLYFYQGFDLSDNNIDILNSEIFFILPNGSKIKIVTELTNNINTIKLLKGSILTTDLNISQYRDGMEIGLFNFDIDNNIFNTMNVKAYVANTKNLINKYLPTNIFRIDFLNNPNISKDLSSNNIELIDFDCNSQQNAILDARKFLISLNTFKLFNNIYSKATKYFEHSGSITFSVAGANGEFSAAYFYYDQINKCVSKLLYNNEDLTEFNAENLKDGIYILKIRDPYGNKLKFVNGQNYDNLYIEALNFILNELDLDEQQLNFEYGDMLINIKDLSKIRNVGSFSPGIEEEEPEEVLPPLVTPRIITTATFAVSPNTSYNNRVVIQTRPGKIEYHVTGPKGYSKKFSDRAILIQLPPGVYTIKGDNDSLNSNYLYQQIKTINVNKDTNIFVEMNFISYQDQVVINNICNNI